MTHKSKLRIIRENEGWTRAEVARAANIAGATYRKAENGDAVRDDIWGKILKGINSFERKERIYTMRHIRG